MASLAKTKVVYTLNVEIKRRIEMINKGQVPEGYKKTKVGIIPEDWEVKKLEKVADVKGGKRIPKGYMLEARNNGYPYITVSDMYMGGINTADIKYVPLAVVEKIKNYRIYKDDIFISVAGTLGIVGTIPEELDGANLTENADKITNIKINKNYLLYVCKSHIIQNEIEKEKTTNAQPKLALKRIRNFNIPIPSKKEQQKIAQILSTWDEAIELKEKLIEEKKEQKKGLMQKLLTGEVRLPGFDGEWEEVRLGEVADLYQPQTIAQSEMELEGYPVYGANGLIGYYSKYNHETWQIMITCRGSTCGTVNKSAEKSWITGNAMVVNVDNSINVDKKFIYYLCLNQNFNSIISGSGQPQITRTPLSNFKITISDNIEEQKAIAQILSTADKEIELLEQELEQLKLQKKGLMQLLLTGIIRVN